MKQPTLEITDLSGKYIGNRKITSLNWNNDLLWVISVDFMEDGNSNDYLAFYLESGEKYISIHRNLIGYIKT